METDTINRNNYEKPEIEVVTMETDKPQLTQTSYHYEPGWDD